MFHKPSGGRAPLKDDRKPLNQAGDSLRYAINEYIDNQMLLWGLTPIVSAVFAAYLWLLVIGGFDPTGAATAFTLVTVVLMPISIWRIMRARHRIDQLRQGYEGERYVGQLLEELRIRGYKVFHDIPGDAKETYNIDHALIGPAGVFAIETKCWTKPEDEARLDWDGRTLLHTGQPIAEDALKQARASADRLREILQQHTGWRDIPVRAVLMFPGWWINQNASLDADATWVLNPIRIFGYIDHEPGDRLSPDRVTRLAKDLEDYVRKQKG